MRYAVSSPFQPYLTDADRAEIESIREALSSLKTQRKEIGKRWQRLTGRLRQRAFRESKRV